MALRKLLMASLAILLLMSTLYTPRKVDAAATVAGALPGVIEFLGAAIGIYEGATIRNDPTDAMREGVTDIAKLYALSQFESLKNSLSATYDSVSNWFVKSDALSGDLKTFKGLSFGATMPEGWPVATYSLSLRTQLFDGQNSFGVYAKHVNTDKPTAREWAWLRDGMLFTSIFYIEEQRQSSLSAGTLLFYQPFGYEGGAWTSSAFYFNLGNIGIHEFNQVEGGTQKLLDMVGYPVNVAEYQATAAGYTDQVFKDALPDKIRIPALEDFKPVDNTTGEDLTYRPQTNDYVNPAGNVIPTPRVKWTYPTPTIVKDIEGKDTVGWTDTTTGDTKTWDGTKSTDVPGTGDTTWIGKLIKQLGDALARWFVPTSINTAPLTNVWVSRFPAIQSITSSLTALVSISGNGQCPVWQLRFGNEQYDFINLCELDQKWINTGKMFIRIMLWSTFVFMVLREFRPKPTIG